MICAAICKLAMVRFDGIVQKLMKFTKTINITLLIYTSLLHPVQKQTPHVRAFLLSIPDKKEKQLKLLVIISITIT